MSKQKQQQSQFDLQVKVLLLGNSNVGKTWLLIRYSQEIEPSLSIATIGIDFKVKYLNIEGSKIKLQLWDTAGAERFQSLTSSVYRGVHGVILIYDVTERKSFASIEAWIGQIYKHADTDVNIVLVGNKCDVNAEEREVSMEEGETLADRFSVPFFEASAKKNVNVENIFLRIAAEVKHRLAREAIDSPRKKQKDAEIKASMIQDIEKSTSASGNSMKSGCC